MINTTLCYIGREGKYLLLHRVKKEHDLNKDKWIGIGGKFEEGESPEDCVVREAREETGLTLVRPQYKGIVTFISDASPTEFMHLFVATEFTGTLLDCDEGVLEWVPKEKMFGLPHWKGDEIFLSLIAREVPFFSLKLTYKGSTLTEAILNGKSVNADDYSLNSAPAFAPVRRKDREIPEAEARELLGKGSYGVLSTVNADGYPYGIPLNYVFDGEKIYFHCAKLSGEKLRAFERLSKVCFTVVGDVETLPEKFSTKYESAVVFGRIAKSADAHPGLQKLIAKYSTDYKAEGDAYIGQALARVAVYEITVDHITGKARR